MLTYLVAGCFVVTGVGWVLYTVHHEAGATVTLVFAMTIVACGFAGLESLRLLRGSRVFITAALTISGTFLTLVIGYQLEHPAISDSNQKFVGWVLIATGFAFAASITADVRTHRLEAQAQAASKRQEDERLEEQRREAAAREQRAVQRHTDLMAELTRLHDAHAGPPRTTVGLRVDRAAAWIRTLRR